MVAVIVIVVVSVIGVVVCFVGMVLKKDDILSIIILLCFIEVVYNFEINFVSSSFRLRRVRSYG